MVKIPNDKIQGVVEILKNNSIQYDDFGILQDSAMTFNGDVNLPIEELSEVHKYWLQEYMKN